MTTQRYAIGIQTFSEIIEGGYAYVDKTGYIPSLIRHAKYIFLSRPHRFGKSLCLSTLEVYFEGRQTLFKGLALDDMPVDWTPSPVLHFDFNNGLYESSAGLLVHMDDMLDYYERKFGIYATGRTREDIPKRFRHLIRTDQDSLRKDRPESRDSH